jgi:hypothetical protein
VAVLEVTSEAELVEITIGAVGIVCCVVKSTQAPSARWPPSRFETATAWKEYEVPEESPEIPILKLPGPVMVCREVD